MRNQTCNPRFWRPQACHRSMRVCALCTPGCAPVRAPGYPTGSYVSSVNLRSLSADARGRRKMAIVRFRPAGDRADELRIGIDGSDDVSLKVTGGAPESPVPLTLNATLPGSELPAYGRVQLDVLDGGNTLSIGGDESGGGLARRHSGARRLGERCRSAREVSSRAGGSTPRAVTTRPSGLPLRTGGASR
jgi:hypothetical protein